MDGRISGQFSGVSGGDVGLSDEMLLQICRVSMEDEPVTSEWMDDLRLVASIVADSRMPKRDGLQEAMTLLAAALGQLPQHNPTHLPFGYSGPTVRSQQWIKRETMEQLGKQIVGMIWHDASPDTVASCVHGAVSRAIHLGYMEQQEYDAWRPGMRSGSGWRSAVTATPYGVTKARAWSSPGSSTAPSDDSIDSARRREDAARSGGGDGSGFDPVSLSYELGKTSRAVPRAKRPARVPSPAGAGAEDRYAWARQAELVRATDQVLGRGTLHKGVLSRACSRGQVETNGKPGRGSRVKVSTFLPWVSRRFDLARDEQTQIRNAIIGEIRTRNR